MDVKQKPLHHTQTATKKQPKPNNHQNPQPKRCDVQKKTTTQRALQPPQKDLFKGKFFIE
jgi:hypothetical protein